MRKEPLILLILSFTGCQVAPTYCPPEMVFPEKWHSEPSSLPLECESENNWWEEFKDPKLNALIEKASQKNLDLQIIGIRIQQARLLYKGEIAKHLPHVDATLSGGNLSFGKKGLLSTVLDSHCCSFQRNINFLEVGFDASWEIDLFGVSKHEKNGAQAHIEAAEEEMEGARLTLSAEIAKNYIEFKALELKIDLFAKNIKEQQETLILTKELFQAGTASEIDILRAQEHLFLLQAESPKLQQAKVLTIHRLATLLNIPQDEIFCELQESTCTLPNFPTSLSAGIPSELLRHRPDIRKAERELAAASEETSAAIAELYPRFSLFGFLGEIGSSLKSLSTGQAATAFICPELLLPLFNSQSLKRNVAMNELKTKEALLFYQKTLLTAFEEVENALSLLREEKTKESATERALSVENEIMNLTQDLYLKGFKDYLTLLTTQRALLETNITLIDIQKEMLLHYISLKKAVGG